MEISTYDKNANNSYFNTDGEKKDLGCRFSFGLDEVNPYCSFQLLIGLYCDTSL